MTWLAQIIFTCQPYATTLLGGIILLTKTNVSQMTTARCTFQYESIPLCDRREKVRADCPLGHRSQMLRSLRWKETKVKMFKWVAKYTVMHLIGYMYKETVEV